MITPETIAQIKEASRLATKGLWKYEYDWLKTEYGDRIATFDPVVALRHQSADTGEFIALARNHIDSLIERVEELEKTIENVNMRSNEKAYMDRIVFGSSMVKVHNDGHAEHIPIEKTVLEPKEEIETPLLKEIKSLTLDNENLKKRVEELEREIKVRKQDSENESIKEDLRIMSEFNFTYGEGKHRWTMKIDSLTAENNKMRECLKTLVGQEPFKHTYNPYKASECLAEIDSKKENLE